MRAACRRGVRSAATPASLACLYGRFVHRFTTGAQLVRLLMALRRALAAHGIATNGSRWDEFANDPTTVKESEILTNIYFPIK